MNIGDIGGEFEFIKRISCYYGQTDEVVVGSGHDAAILNISGKLAVTTDMLIEGRHFRSDWISPEDIGWRAAVASISDIAAFGGKPVAGFLSIGIPLDMEASDAEEVCRGVASAFKNVGASVAGGDTVASDIGLVLNVCLVGEVENPPKLRSGANPGDLVCVTGRLGGPRGAVLALEKVGRDKAFYEHFSLVKCYRRPTARLAAGKFLNECAAVTSVMDVSDGLASDIRRICEASGAGAEIDLMKLPFHPDIIPVAALIGESPRRCALIGGEEFELLFTISPDDPDEVLADLLVEGMAQGTVIGHITENRDIILIDERGNKTELMRGFQHFS